MAVANADAGFQRMRAEPAHRPQLLPVGFNLLVYLHRISRHATALAALLEGLRSCGEPLPEHQLVKLRELLDVVFEDLARLVSEGRAPIAWPRIGTGLAELAAQLMPAGGAGPAGSVALLLGRLVNDLTGMLGAAGYYRGEAAQQEGSLVPSS